MRVLLVDDEEPILRVTKIVLRQGGLHDVISCSDSRQVLDIVRGGEIRVVVLDLTMPEFSGEEVLALLQGEFPELPVIIMTGLNEVETAVRCMQSGAFDYMVKPVEPMRLVSGIRRALEIHALRAELDTFKDHMLATELRSPGSFAHLVTRNARMMTLFHYIEAVAEGSRPVLILGETGTGKELFARAVHLASGRRGEFVVVNAAGVDDHVFSDTLFGHKKGAFTGADRDRPGLLSRAAEGTLFLDEIGDLSLPSQVKLLRLLQNGEYVPLGSDAPVFTSARVVAATNADLPALQGAGKFRQDLYFRLQAHEVRIPALRDRLDDLPLLLEHFLASAARELKKRKPTAPKELHALLATYHFPGNVRELEAMVFNAVSRHTSRTLSMEAFSDRMAQQRREEEANGGKVLDASPFTLFDALPTLRGAQNLLIEEAIRRARGNQSVAARLLGISQSGLSKAMKRLGDEAGGSAAE